MDNFHQQNQSLNRLTGGNLLAYMAESILTAPYRNNKPEMYFCEECSRFVYEEEWLTGDKCCTNCFEKGE